MTDETLFAQPVTGHRAWKLDPQKMTLAGVYGVWDCGFLEARCDKWGHEAPHWPDPEPEKEKPRSSSALFLPSLLHGSMYDYEGRCLCGINAYKMHVSPERLSRHAEEGEGFRLNVVGMVDLGGKVHEYDNGYRAQYGRIVEATVTTHIPLGSRFLTYLSEKYEAPFRVMPWHEFQNEWELTHGRDWTTEAEDQDTEAGAEADPPASSGASQGTSPDPYVEMMKELSKSLDRRLFDPAVKPEPPKRPQPWYQRWWT